MRWLCTSDTRALRAACPDAQPGARALMAWWLARFGGRGAINSGILNCRPVVGGTARSLHSEGRAADLGVRPINAALRARGSQPVARPLG